jgi:ADP-ribose pyrophosphatase
MPHQPARPHGPWLIHATHETYQDPYVRLWVDQVTRPDGRLGQHVVVEMKPGVCVLAMDDDDHVYLTSEFHYAVGRVSLEGVSGGIEPGEDPLETAQRELAEELGLQATEWEYLTTVDPFTTIIRSPTRLYLARGLTSCPTQQEGTEVIDLVKLPLRQALDHIQSGEISHAPTCVGLLLSAERA